MTTSSPSVIPATPIAMTPVVPSKICGLMSMMTTPSTQFTDLFFIHQRSLHGSGAIPLQEYHRRLRNCYSRHAYEPDCLRHRCVIPTAVRQRPVWCEGVAFEMRCHALIHLKYVSVAELLVMQFYIPSSALRIMMVLHDLKVFMLNYYTQTSFRVTHYTICDPQDEQNGPAVGFPHELQKRCPLAAGRIRPSADWEVHTGWTRFRASEFHTGWPPPVLSGIDTYTFWFRRPQ